MQDTIEKIKGRIKIFGIKQSHVAEKCGISPVRLSHYLNGRRELHPEEKAKLTSYLGL